MNYFSILISTVAPSPFRLSIFIVAPMVFSRSLIIR